MSPLFDANVIALTLVLIIGMVIGHMLGFYGGRKHWRAVEWQEQYFKRVEADRARRNKQGQWKNKGVNS